MRGRKATFLAPASPKPPSSPRIRSALLPAGEKREAGAHSPSKGILTLALGVSRREDHRGGLSNPPSRQICRYSSSVTGCTDSRIEVTKAIFSNAGLALISFSEIGFGRSQTARISTQSHLGSPSAVESGCDSAQTSVIPTISSPSFEW